MSRDDPLRDNDRFILARWSEGARSKEIARALGWPLHRVASRLDALRAEGRIGFRNKHWTPREIGRLLALRDAGLSYREIAPAFDCSPAAAKMQAMNARKAMAGDGAQMTFELAAA